jgi:hypothetical protein
VIFIKLVRIVGAGLAAGLICHLLCSAAKKSMANRPHRKGGKTRRKYVESSVVEKKDKASESDKERP